MELIQTVVVPFVAPPRFNDLSLCPTQVHLKFREAPNLLSAFAR
jgi:hypothetical protein